MNRERNHAGGNSYEKDLGIAPLQVLRRALERQDQVAWLDLCCGFGRALLQAAKESESLGLKDRIKFVGVDIVPIFDAIPSRLRTVHLVPVSVERWEAQERFDLITCVHGLHYVGDKLGLLQRACGWMTETGLLMMHLDYRNLKIAGRRSSGVQVGKELHRNGFRYLSRRHLLVRSGAGTFNGFPYRYLGADDKGGPNYTGQAAVDSYYERIGN